ncbi:hypothetical protein SAMN04487948_106165 [Halogranum amylolyticum]|uniref:Uncharacterized protein n=1 Tax=Halogranum amylolyticum TaxID=660520 RepID=A0A1H8TBZ6_9EURY|nr:hypothetical protein [Halogranum amylolyticum]SEO88422.1 hypothetical protein SAMN04487948_106165 [Halogranum amylolyticum]
MNDQKRDTAASFGAAAEDDVESAVHRGSDDLEFDAWIEQTGGVRRGPRGTPAAVP